MASRPRGWAMRVRSRRRRATRSRGFSFGMDPARQCPRLRRRRHDAGRCEETARCDAGPVEAAGIGQAGQAFRNRHSAAPAADPAGRPAEFAAVGDPRAARCCAQRAATTWSPAVRPMMFSAATSSRASTPTCARPRAGPMACAAASRPTEDAAAVSLPRRSRPTAPAIRSRRCGATCKSFLGDKGVTAEELERTVNGSVRELPGSFETSDDVLGAMQNDRLIRAVPTIITRRSRPLIKR